MPNALLLVPLSFPVSNLFFPHFFCLLFFPSALYFSSPFLLLLLSKTIKVKIIDDEEYEKNKTFYIEIGEPRLVESNDTKGQEEGEPWTLTLWSQSVPHISEAACSQHLEAHWRRLRLQCFFLLMCLLMCAHYDGEHAAGCVSPHLTTSTTLLCVYASVFLFGFVCTCIPCHVFFVYYACIHHLPLCLCMCVCVYTCIPYRKTITVRILDREEYNKQSSFYILLETPEWRRSGKKWTGVTDNQHWECTVWGFNGCWINRPSTFHHSFI